MMINKSELFSHNKQAAVRKDKTVGLANNWQCESVQRAQLEPQNELQTKLKQITCVYKF